jgi:hypothetical protein
VCAQQACAKPSLPRCCRSRNLVRTAVSGTVVPVSAWSVDSVSWRIVLRVGLPRVIILQRFRALIPDRLIQLVRLCSAIYCMYRHAHAPSRPKSATLCHIQMTLFGGLQPLGLAAASLPVPINLQPILVASLRRLPRHLPPPCPLPARLRAPASCLPSSGVEGAPPAIS